MSQGFSTVSDDTALNQRILELGDALRQRGWHVSCAESCTGGGIAFAFTSVSGSSDWFNQSWVTYSNDAKHQQLGVNESTLAEHGAVSEQTVAEMVSGVINNTSANVGISVSGIAGPGGGTEEKPVGTVWFGFAIDGNITCNKVQFDGNRDAVRHQAIAYAICYLHQRLVASE